MQVASSSTAAASTAPRLRCAPCTSLAQRNVTVAPSRDRGVVIAGCQGSRGLRCSATAPVTALHRPPLRPQPCRRGVAASAAASAAGLGGGIVDGSDADAADVYDAIIIGSGMGGLATAARMVAGGARVLVLEKYTIPGGSAAYFQRDGYTFDVGSSMMFGLGDRGTTNLLTECLRTVGKSVETVLDPTQLHYHLPRSERHPQGLDVKVWNSYEAFVAELTSRFPHEAAGIRSFYGDAWKVFNALNAMDLKSLEEPRYLIEQLFKSPRGCLSLLGWLPANTGDIARKYISDPELLRFIDAECYIFSTVAACATPMVTSGMVFSDRHYGGIRYPKGGVGTLARKLAEGIEQAGGAILYRANATCVLFDEAGAAAGVRLSDGREFRSRAVVSNATRWDTFGRLLGGREPPEAEKLFLSRYKKSPSFFSMHLGIRADVLPPGTECHHVVVDDWDKMEEARHTLFISIPSLLDPSLAPDGHHTVHAFTPDWIDAWEGLSPEEYAREKDALCASLLRRMDARFPGISSAVTFKEVGTPRTHRRFLGRPDGTYGPIPSRNPLGIITMPFNTTDVPGLYCVGDSTFPGQGVNAVVFSGFGCAHRALCDLGLEKSWPLVDSGYRALIRAARMAAQKMGPKDGEQEPAEVTRSGAPLGTGARPPVPVTNNIITFAHQPAHVQQQQQQ